MIALLLAAQVTVLGIVQYEDRDYTNSGFTGTTTARPIRSADIEILRASDSTVLGSGATDATGSFSIGSIASGEVVRARVYARHAGGGINAVVKNNTTSNAVYAALTRATDQPARVSKDAGCLCSPHVRFFMFLSGRMRGYTG